LEYKIKFNGEVVAAFKDQCDRDASFKALTAFWYVCAYRFESFNSVAPSLTLKNEIKFNGEVIATFKNQADAEVSFKGLIDTSPYNKKTLEVVYYRGMSV